MSTPGLWGRPFQTSSVADSSVYDRPQGITEHPGFYDSEDDRRARKQADEQLPDRPKLPLLASTRLLNSLGHETDIWNVEDARATLQITPTSGGLFPFSLDRDLSLDGGRIPSSEPGAGIYLGVRTWSATAVATTATGDISWAIQIGNGPYLSLGTTPASPTNVPLIGVFGMVPYPLGPDRILAGTTVGNILTTTDTLAAAVAIRVHLGFTLVYSLPPGR